MAPQLSIKQWALSLTILALVLALGVYQLVEITERHFSVSFLDVGQGDAILIQTPEYKNVLIDAGPDSKVVGELSKKLSFFNQQIDLFILTHPDSDHMTGIFDILQKYPVKEVIMTGIAGQSGLYREFLRQIGDDQIPIIYPASGHDLRIGNGYFLDILFPFEGQSLIGQEVKNTNNTSISLVVRDAAKKPIVLLTGDAEAPEELDLLLSGQDVSCPVFKLGHHGSKTASSALFLQAVQPQTVIISASKGNKFGHPNPETLERVKGLEVRQTMDEGAITFQL